MLPKCLIGTGLDRISQNIQIFFDNQMPYFLVSRFARDIALINHPLEFFAVDWAVSKVGCATLESALSFTIREPVKQQAA
jgi:hypothetical protein